MESLLGYKRVKDLIAIIALAFFIGVLSCISYKLAIIIFGIFLALCLLFSKKLYLYITLVICAINIILNYSAQGFGIVIGGIPLTFMDAVLFIGVGRVILRFFTRKEAGKRSDEVIILIISGVAFIRFIYGMIFVDKLALRDATHYINMLYFIVIISELTYLKNRVNITRLFSRYIRIVFNIMFFYALFMPFGNIIQVISPKLPGLQSAIPILGSFTITHLWLVILIMYNLYSLDRRLVNKRYSIFYHIQNIISLALILYSTSRITIISLIVLLFIFAVKKENYILKNFLKYFVIFVIIILVIEVFNIQIKLERGYLNFEMIKNIFLSAVGLGTHEGMASGHSERIKYLQDILITHSDLKSIFVGGGFGYPLIEFKNMEGAAVREPHNSYLSVYARMGIVTLSLWVTFLISKVKISLKNMKNSVYSLILFLVLFLCMLNATVETFFETPFEATTFYILLGILTYIVSSRREKNECTKR